jgi:geranylgeranyl diphosphate synthase type II
MNNIDFHKDQYERDRVCIEAILDECLTPPRGFEQSKVWQAARYSALGGGKRVRPIQLLMACRIFGDDIPDTAYRFATAIEMIHSYSLIHDDLPSMDNDDYRRGQPSCHKVFGEGIAILAGDLLLNLAFETMLDSIGTMCSEAHWRAMRTVARSAGGRGMVLGQDLDLSMENDCFSSVTIEDVESMALLKTGSLIAGAIETAGHLCGASDEDLRDLRCAGQHLGLAFQIRDDILDGVELSNHFGKTRHKDERDGKKTFVTVAGREKAIALLSEHTDAAMDAFQRLEHRGKEVGVLKELTRRLMERTY